MKGELRLDLYLFGKDIDLDLRLYDFSRLLQHGPHAADHQQVPLRQ